MKNSFVLALVAALGLVSIIATACGGGTGAPTSAPKPQPTSQPNKTLLPQQPAAVQTAPSVQKSSRGAQDLRGKWDYTSMTTSQPGAPTEVDNDTGQTLELRDDGTWYLAFYDSEANVQGKYTVQNNELILTGEDGASYADYSFELDESGQQLTLSETSAEAGTITITATHE